MKRIIIISSFAATALFTLTGCAGTEQHRTGIKNIETNNKELQANAQLITSQKLESKTDNNLPDPTLSYAHLWGAKDKNETIGELVVSQSFDFPSLYATRNKLNRLKAGAYDSQADVFRQDKLLQAKEVCLDIIMLRQQKQILEERLRNAEVLAEMYAKRLQTGDANALETNKINLELLNVRTEASLNETALRNKMQELNTLNGNIPVVFEESRYPHSFSLRLPDLEIGSALCRPYPHGARQRKPRCPETNSGQQIAVVAETGTGISPEHRNGHTFQRGSSRLLFPSFRKPEQGEDCESTSFEHRPAKRKCHVAS